MVNRKDIEQSTDQENLASNHRYRMFLVLPPLVVIVGILLVISLRGTHPGMLNQQITTRQTYLDILGEPHTGLRLARLKDFTAHTPQNTDTRRAKTRQNTLAISEQNAWAGLTDVLYGIGKTRDEKTRAVAHYKTNWDVWSRQTDLPKLLAVTGLVEAQQTVLATSPNTHPADELILPSYSPQNKSSRYAKGNTEASLAGDIASYTNTQYLPTTITTQPLNAGHIRPVRIKFAKRPRYPRRAYRKGISGQITLALDIDERGHVVRTTVISAKAPRYKDNFIRAARRAAMASKFHPKTEAGQAVATSRYVRKYSFTAGG
ncbi:MAG: TonB family protein [Robiginitomaculum sp.]|nr:TonB family protein [Robiginitomaculum sp.]